MRNGSGNSAHAHDVHMLSQGPRAWNAWRQANPDAAADLNDLRLPVGQRQFGQVQGGPIDLNRAELCRADLEHATLIGANLACALLIEANLSSARLEGADLRGADLSNANFDDADLKDARLGGAILCGARLHDARNLTQAQIDGTQGDHATTLPPALTIPEGWLGNAKTKVSPLEKRVRAEADLKGDLYAALGVNRGASPREIRAAYLRLVKDLHPDGGLDDPEAGERLKVINRAYHDLKQLERRAAARKAERGFMGQRSVLFATGVLASVLPMLVAGAVLYRAGYFAADAPAEVEAVRVTMAVTPAPDPQAAPAEADDAAWAEAEREGTSLALHRYLERYPQGRHAQKASEHARFVAASEAIIEGREGGATGTHRPALGGYLERHPGGQLAPSVRRALAVIDAADTAAWNGAQQKPSKEAYRGYLDAYPGGNHAGAAQQALAAIERVEAALRADQRAWAEAQRIGTRKALSWYLEAYPDGVNAANAHQAVAAIDRIEAILRADQGAWSEAQRTGTRAAVDRYLDAYPDGAHIAEAHRALAAFDRIEVVLRADRAAWAEALRAGTREALAGYLEAHPEGTSAEKARQAIAALEAVAEKHRVMQDSLAWLEAQRRNTRAGYATYLGAHPNGDHANEARGRMSALEPTGTRAADVAIPKVPGRATTASRERASATPARQLRPPADEPFIGADGRIRQP